ncbi:hypothetical protein [Nannocystis pusilla]|uniref:hypothetical protein n=1 Tax=Nannocystis pusilla TaxID=889268 RepID=UPI003B7D6449
MSSRPLLLALLGPLACGAGQEPAEPASTPREQPAAKKAVAEAPDAKAADAKALDAKAPDAGASASAYQCAVPLQLNGNVPPDIYPHNNDRDANCFGWQEFIALNWPVAAGAGFGDPGDTGPVAWQGYMSSNQLFRPDGSARRRGARRRRSPRVPRRGGHDRRRRARRHSADHVDRFSSEFESGDGQQAARATPPRGSATSAATTSGTRSASARTSTTRSSRISSTTATARPPIIKRTRTPPWPCRSAPSSPRRSAPSSSRPPGWRSRTRTTPSGTATSWRRRSSSIRPPRSARR